MPSMELIGRANMSKPNLLILLLALVVLFAACCTGKNRTIETAREDGEPLQGFAYGYRALPDSITGYDVAHAEYEILPSGLDDNIVIGIRDRR
jgi:hypothetical protein